MSVCPWDLDLNISLNLNRKHWKDIQDLISTLLEVLRFSLIIAIGNDGPGNMRAPGYFPETLSVGAVDFNHKPADFSGGGFSTIDGKAQPDIVGYGVNIFSSLERDENNKSLYDI